jgi:hypothetical protein
MTEDDPRPLKSGSEAPPELVRALRALGRDRDSARLLRVADRLGALLDAPPPAPTTGVRKLLGSKLAITGIVVGLAGLGLLAYELAARQPEPSVPTVPAAQLEHAQPTAAVPNPALPPPPAASSMPYPAAPSGSGARRSRRHSASASRPTIAAAPPTALAAQPAATVDSAPAPSASPEPAAKPPREPTPAAQPAEHEKPRTELQLLFEARKALQAQPEAALRLLAEHAARFHNGQLAPEREVLAIEALRKLGRNTEADQRLREFQARYPQSIHLRRLQEKP